MKSRIIPVLAVFALLCCSCGGGIRDIRITSCEVKSLNPAGFAKMDATLEIGVHNPAPELHLTELEGEARFQGSPCLSLSAQDIVLEGRTDKTYTVIVTGKISKDFDLLQILSLVRDTPKLNDITLDISARASLGAGTGRKIAKKDIPLRDIIDKF